MRYTRARQPAAAGRFYPKDEEALGEMVRDYLAGSSSELERRPRAVIAPHAGYVFSGAVAGAAFGALKPWADTIERVVLIGPSHFTPVSGLVVDNHAGFETPLGEVPVDAEAVEALVDDELVEVAEEPHRREHSLETHLPFLQQLLGDFTIVPIVTGSGDGRRVAEVIERFDDEETLISVSSDLSHYHDYESARQIDEKTRRAIEALDPESLEDEQACGHTAIRGVLRVGRRSDLSVETLEICNSGDTAGDRDRVVGYGAWALY